MCLRKRKEFRCTTNIGYGVYKPKGVVFAKNEIICCMLNPALTRAKDEPGAPPYHIGAMLTKMYVGNGNYVSDYKSFKACSFNDKGCIEPVAKAPLWYFLNYSCTPTLKAAMYKFVDNEGLQRTGVYFYAIEPISAKSCFLSLNYNSYGKDRDPCYSVVDHGRYSPCRRECTPGKCPPWPPD